MDAVFHEKQEGSLCAQHCLNSLLQGAYFSAVDLASIAQDLDDAERDRMAEGDVNSPEYLRFLEQPSANMDDSGFFSVQVISNALSVWGLQLIPIASSEAGAASLQPGRETAFICNFREHWLTIRKLGNQWFNLNSLLTGPELISDTYLSMFLAQLQREGYSIFVVKGNLPESEADQLLKLIPAVQTERPKLLSELAQSSSSSSSSRTTSSGTSVTQDDLQRALEASRRVMSGGQEDEESNLQEAIKLSLQGNQSSVAVESSEPVNLDDVRRRREAYFNRQLESQSSSSMKPATNATATHNEARHQETGSERLSNSTTSPGDIQTKAMSCAARTQEETGEVVAMGQSDEDMTETAMLEAAIKMSMETAERKT